MHTLIKKHLPAIIVVVIGLLPLAVFAVNWYTLMEIAMLNAASGNTVLAGSAALILFSAMFTGFRFIYSPKQQKRFARLTTLSFSMTIVSAGIFGIGLIGVMNYLDLLIPTTETATYLIAGLIVIFAQVTLIDLRLFDTKPNTPVPNAMNTALTETRTPLSLITLFGLAATFGLSLLLPENTPLLLMLGVLVLWGGIYSTILYPVILRTVVSLFPQRI